MEKESPETVGEYLANARESSGLTVEDVSSVTKVARRYIEAIENDDFSMFSSPQLLRGYVKLLAKTVKADGKKTASLLEDAISKDFKGRNPEDIVGKRFKEERQKSEDFKKKFLIIIFSGILIIILSYAAVKTNEFIRSTGGISMLKHYIPPAIKSEPPKIKKQVNYRKQNIKYAVVLKGKAVHRTWVAVKIDHEPAKASMLHAGNTVAWKARKRLWIKIGNAGGIILNYNGKNLGKPGTESQVVTLNFPSPAKLK